MTPWDDVRAECRKLGDWLIANATLRDQPQNIVTFSDKTKALTDEGGIIPNGAISIDIACDDPGQAVISLSGVSRLVRETSGAVLVRLLPKVWDYTPDGADKLISVMRCRLFIMWP